MQIFNLSTYTKSKRYCDIIVNMNKTTYGIIFDSITLRDRELIKYISVIATSNYFCPRYINVCIEVAKQLNMLDKVKSILLLTKYNSLTNANL